MRTRGISLVEVLIVLALLSSLLLPLGMYLAEYMRGSTSLGEFHQVLNIIEERMELALSYPYNDLPVGLVENRHIPHRSGPGIDLRSVTVGDNLVHLSLDVTVIPLDFSVVVNPAVGEVRRFSAENSMKKLFLKAVWGRNNEHSLDLTAYKADL